MRSIQIIVGSMLGCTEYVAEACEATLTANGYQCQLHFQPKLSDIPQQNQTWLICTSTHGAGDYPDNIKNFATELHNTESDLSTIEFFVIGIGDSSYDTFCQAAKNIEKTLLSKGCKKIIPSKFFDMQEDIDPELAAQQWIESQTDQLS